MEEGDLKSLSPSTTNTEGLSEEEERILLEKEFDDYYEDRVHKSAGPVVFLSKSMAMLPVIWTDDEAESELGKGLRRSLNANSLVRIEHVSSIINTLKGLAAHS